MTSLLILGYVLSLDNFRLSIALGAFKLNWRRALRIAVVFGFWDCLSPLVGVLIGCYFGQEIGPAAEIIGPIVLLVYGLYLVVRSLQTEAPEDLHERMALFGIPLSLSLDNLLAGTGLGMLGFPPCSRQGSLAPSRPLCRSLAYNSGESPPASYRSAPISSVVWGSRSRLSCWH